MNFDFELVLVIIAAFTGVVSLLEKLWWKPARMAKLLSEEPNLTHSTHAQMRHEPTVVEWSRSLFPVFFLVLILRSFFMEPYQIPSGSMLPTLQIGDFIVVNKYTYGLRLPLTGDKLLHIDEPQRGDVMVFKFPQNPKIKFIKRVVGLPGDRVEYRNKVLIINDEPVPQTLVKQTDLVTGQYLEQLGEHNHALWRNIATDIDRQYVVPAGHYFVLGDNRDSSNDSRYWGYVSERLVVGKAVAIWLHWPDFFSLPNFSTAGVIE
jgi:signal peptidase I